MNLAFFGGSFNPPHIGHEMIIEYCYNLFDQFIVIPNRISPEKKYDVSISENHKLDMLKIIIKRINNYLLLLCSNIINKVY